RGDRSACRTRQLRGGRRDEVARLRRFATASVPRSPERTVEVVMRWLSGMGLLLLGMVLVLGGCGGSSEDETILAFQGFTDENVGQSDAVGSTSADVDVCQGLCGTFDNPTAEPFTQTRVGAIFVNRGKADITIDSYTVSVPDSGVPDETFSVTARINGGRCGGDQ